jgi:hypothetical protein
MKARLNSCCRNEDVDLFDKERAQLTMLKYLVISRNSYTGDSDET